MDFVAILSNLLENALNGCKECGSQGEIRVDIRTVTDKVVIVCSNPCKPDLAIENGMLHNRGTGIESVVLAVRKYDGDIRYELEDGYLTAVSYTHLKRGTGSQSSYKGNIGGSLPEYSFHWHGQSDRLYLFEAPIDLLSFISMNKDEWQQHSYAACCGVSDAVMWRMFKDNPNIDKVSLCLDNDEPGQQAAERISGKLREKGKPSEILTPTLKAVSYTHLDVYKRQSGPCFIENRFIIACFFL